MKRNHVRWLTAIITTALLLLGAGLPAKAQLVVSDPTVLASEAAEFAKQFQRYSEETKKWAALYGKISSIVSDGRAVIKAVNAVDDLSKLPDAVLRKQRNNKYLYDFEKIRSWEQTMSILKECMSLVDELKNFSEARKSATGEIIQMSQADRYNIIKKLSDEVIALRNKAYRIVNYYNKLAEGRSREATTQRLFDQLNGYN